MISSRVQRVTRRPPPAFCADGVMVTLRPLAAARVERHAVYRPPCAHAIGRSMAALCCWSMRCAAYMRNGLPMRIMTIQADRPIRRVARVEPGSNPESQRRLGRGGSVRLRARFRMLRAALDRLYKASYADRFPYSRPADAFCPSSWTETPTTDKNRTGRKCRDRRKKNQQFRHPHPPTQPQLTSAAAGAGPRGLGEPVAAQLEHRGAAPARDLDGALLPATSTVKTRPVAPVGDLDVLEFAEADLAQLALHVAVGQPHAPVWRARCRRGRRRRGAGTGPRGRRRSPRRWPRCGRPRSSGRTSGRSRRRSGRRARGWRGRRRCAAVSPRPRGRPASACRGRGRRLGRCGGCAARRSARRRPGP